MNGNGSVAASIHSWLSVSVTDERPLHVGMTAYAKLVGDPASPICAVVLSW